MDEDTTSEKVLWIAVTIFAVGAFFLAGLRIGSSDFQHRLDATRQQLELARIQSQEYERREREIADIAQRTGGVLQESIDTISDIRRVIEQIRENYIQMENILFSTSRDDSDNVSDSTPKEIE